MGQKPKKRSLLTNLTMSRALSLSYLLLYMAVFVYIWVHHGIFEAVWYVGLIPVLLASLGGVAYLLRRVAKGKRKGTVAALNESGLPGL